MTPKKLWLRPDQIRPLLSNDDGCMATDRITVDGQLVGYMYREDSVAEADSGWRFLAGDETPAYMEDSSKHGVYAVNTIASHDTAIIPLLDSPAGAAFARDWKTFLFRPDGAEKES